MLHFARATPTRPAKKPLRYQPQFANREKIVLLYLYVLSPFRRLLLGNREHNQWHYEEYKDQESEQEVIHRSLVVEDYIRGKSELVMPRSVVKGSLSVRVVIPKLGTYGNELVWPPSDADGMLRIVGREASPAPNLVLKIFVSHG